MYPCILSPDTTKIITSFACHQNDPQPAGYAELADGDPRIAAWEASLLPNPVPQTVTSYQALMALNNAGLYASVMTYINAQPVATQIQFNKQANFTRTDATLNAAATALGMTSAQVDGLFVAAALITE